MTIRILFAMVIVSAITSAGTIAVYASRFAPTGHRGFATVDIRALVRWKESEIATLLVKNDLPERERAEALQAVTEFGRRLDEAIHQVASDCRCVLLARGALVGAQPDLPDLTAELRRRVGL